jgi:hypothetical protein
MQKKIILSNACINFTLISKKQNELKYLKYYFLIKYNLKF